jgi:hypothetical protein
VRHVNGVEVGVIANVGVTGLEIDVATGGTDVEVGIG